MYNFIETNVKPFIAGGIGGMCTVITGHPFDTVKVRLQTMAAVRENEAPLYRGMIDCFRKTVKYEGFYGLYKGMGPPLVGVMPIFAVCFYSYNLGKRIISDDIQKITKVEIFSAGMLSGVFTTLLTVPGERIKCLLQIQTNSKSLPTYKGPVDVLKKLYISGGIKSIYKGTSATFLRDIPASGVYFLSYEWIKELLTPKNTTNNELGVFKTLFAGGMAGIFNWVVAIPPDVLKSRLQTAPEGKYPKGIRSVFIEIMTNEGFPTLYRGVTPVMIRAFPANAACFLGYEVSMRIMHFFIPPM